ncbi:alpha/beta hydrolase [Demequina capsici]|uniref:Alpha/beta hydrolase n=1 Tax=Demequina capsici TaxID=3075620 RepID=A0AA96F876_9MICO|nr:MULTISPECIES: alpha/beta hydrolase [unclassified Demequina]WNM23786.1 alpha/beta hydrolase [Demequina sp. OYTSA14]WNM26625.1 alpha/beta hydrolase [Demequina sp. PMTSA13]
MSVIPDGTPVVLLNAFPVDRAQWDPLIDAMADIDALPGDVISFDMPGIGEMPIPDEEPSLELIADAAVAAMRETTGHDAAVWIGCSMGGYVAMAVAERHPDAVAGLGLIATRSTADTREAHENRLAMAAAMDGAPGVPDPRAMAEDLVGTQGPGRAALVDAIAANIATHSGAGIAWGQRAMAARPDRTAVLAEIDGPAVVIGGEHDKLVSSHDIAVMAEALFIEPVLVYGVGHLAAFEAPQEVARLLAPLTAG